MIQYVLAVCNNIWLNATVFVVGTTYSGGIQKYLVEYNIIWWDKILYVGTEYVLVGYNIICWDTMPMVSGEYNIIWWDTILSGVIQYYLL